MPRAAFLPTLTGIMSSLPFPGGALTHSVKLANLPQFLNQHGFEELGGLLYAVGGETTVAASNGNYAYDPVANTWATLAVLPILVESPVLRAVGGKLYCIGGLDDSLAVVKKCYQYDPVGDAWAAKTDMPTAREDMGSAVVGTNIYVFGGLTTGNTPTKVLEIYDTVANTWSTGASMPDYKHFGDVGCVVNGQIYALGGSNTFAGYPTLHPDTTCYKYDPGGNTWYTIASIPVGVCYAELEVLNDIIYIVSGCTSSITTFSNIIQSYSPIANKWATETLLAIYSGRGFGTCVYNGDIYVSGGFNVGSQKWFYKLSTSPLGPELVANGGFETNTTGWTFLYTPATYTLAADARPGSAGIKSLDVEIAGIIGDVYATIPFESGKTYFLQAWLKNVNTASWNLVMLSNVFVTLLFTGGVLTTWDNMQETFTGTTAAGYLVIYVNGAAGQHARFDDISIKEILP